MSLFNELKRRNVFRVGAVYVVTAWLVIQVVATIFPAFGFGDAAVRIVVIILAIGFAPMVIFAWAFELTSEGLKKDKDVDRTQSISPQTGKKLDRAIPVVLALALAYFAFDKFVLDPSRDAELVQATTKAVTRQVIESGKPEAADNSIAVLPFLDISPHKDQEFFSDGIADELLNVLARAADLRVVSRTSAFSFKGQNLSISEIARRLNVAHVLEGSIRMAGGQVRITAQLIDAREDVQLWSDTYDRNLEDIFEVHAEIADRVIEQMGVSLAEDWRASQLAKPTDNVEAYTLYLKGRYFQSKRTAGNIVTALEYFNRAVELDPAYAVAYAGIADVWIFRGWYSVLAPKETFPVAKEAVANALAYNDKLGEPYASRAHIHFEFDHDWMAANKDYETAIKLNPKYSVAHHWYGGYLSAMGRHEEALNQAHKALELDPLSLIINTWIGLRHYFAGRYEVALQEYQKALELDPGFAPLQWHMGWAYEQTGRHAEAIAAAQKAITISGGNPLYIASLGHAYAKAGEHDAARKTLDRLAMESESRHVSAYHLAVIHGALGDVDQAMLWLERAYNEKSPWIGYMRVDPRIDPLRSDPRFSALLKQAKLDF